MTVDCPSFEIKYLVEKAIEKIDNSKESNMRVYTKYFNLLKCLNIPIIPTKVTMTVKEYNILFQWANKRS